MVTDISLVVSYNRPCIAYTPFGIIGNWNINDQWYYVAISVPPTNLSTNADLIKAADQLNNIIEIPGRYEAGNYGLRLSGTSYNYTSMTPDTYLNELVGEELFTMQTMSLGVTYIFCQNNDDIQRLNGVIALYENQQ